MRTPLAVAMVVLAASMPSCTSETAPPAVSVSPSVTVSPPPLAAPSPSPSSPAAGLPTSPGPKPPKGPQTPPPAKGVGPAGSIISTGSDAVALTFDDGPWPEYTPEMLDLLKAHNVKATFCVLGRQALTYPDLIRRIHDEGHTFCNHSWRHDMQLGTRGEAWIRDDLNATTKAIHDAAPLAQVSYFRAPGGHFDPSLVAIARSMGMTSIYWHIDTRDWEYSKYTYGQSMVDNIVNRVQTDCRRGSIVLSHDKGKPDTVTAYKTLLPWLKQRYQLIALPPDGRLPRP